HCVEYQRGRIGEWDGHGNGDAACRIDRVVNVRNRLDALGTAANNCTRSDVLERRRESYPPTVTVNGAASAPAQVTNQVRVSGGGSATANTDMDADAHPDSVIRNNDGALGVCFLSGAQDNQITLFSRSHAQ